ncbi:MAG: hypothetical protein IKP06_07815 [Elusimicrobiaceae bacterium]|nr:hypothetical protein [Elusimicrobiaceae bacterium]
MNIGKAAAIFKNINNQEYTDAEKIEAINEVVAMDTHNGITKADVLAALNWAMRYCFFLECQNISLKRVRDFYEKNDAVTDPETVKTQDDETTNDNFYLGRFMQQN